MYKFFNFEKKIISHNWIVSQVLENHLFYTRTYCLIQMKKSEKEVEFSANMME